MVDILESKSEELNKNLEKIWPISEAVISRRFCKKLLEILIRDNINKIDIENYSPDIPIIKSYQKSLLKHYIYRKGINRDIPTTLEEKINNLERETKSQKSGEKKIIPLRCFRRPPCAGTARTPAR